MIVQRPRGPSAVYPPRQAAADGRPLPRATSSAGPARPANRDAAIMDWYRRLAGVRVEEGSPAMAVTIRPSWSGAGAAANG